MGKKSKTKKGEKLYDDDPGCKYIVIENPWPNWGPAASRDRRYFDHIGAWLWYATNKTILPIELCYVSTVSISQNAFARAFIDIIASCCS